MLHSDKSKESRNEVAALAVVSPLVFQPVAIALHTTNLFAVVIGNGVGDRIGGGIDTPFANAIKEFFFFLRK